MAFAQETEARWTWSREEIERVGKRVIDLIAHHLTTLPDRPVFQPYPPALAESLSRTPPENGQDVDAILDEFASHVESYPMGNGHPRFWGWVNSPPAVMGIFADALAAAMNPSCAGLNHAAVYVERQVVEWFKAIAGFPPSGMGLLVSGGSMATLTALTVARHAQLKKAGIDVRAVGLQGGGRNCLVYISGEGHSCIRKAVELLGIGSDNIRTVPVDARRRMDPASLAVMIEHDFDAGHLPIAVAASAGTVNAGAIDPLAAIRQVCDRFGLWMHIDGAYGAAAILTRRYRAELQAIGLADSVALDPHKWLYVPLEAGLVLVRDGALMRDTFSLVPSYLRTDGNPQGVAGPPWLAEFGFQQTRGFRALKVWMALKHHGISGYAEAIERDCALAEYLANRVSAHPDLELVAAGLSIVCFRYAPTARPSDHDQLNAWNRAVLEEIQLGGQVFVSSTELDGRFVLRACIVNHHTESRDLDLLISLVESAGNRQLQQRAEA